MEETRGKQRVSNGRRKQRFHKCVSALKIFLLSYITCLIVFNSEVLSVRTFLIATEVFPWPRYTMGV